MNYSLPLILEFAAKQRIVISRVLAGFVVVLALLSEHSWPEGTRDLLYEGLGFLLVVIASLGRLWSSLYIGGMKNKCIVASGPYSVVRNPLYFFSFIGLLGVGFATENNLCIALLFFSFLLYYPFVIRNEEKVLLSLHGQDYERYMQRTPRFIPNLSLLTEPEEYTVNARKFRQAMCDSMWFLWLFIIFHIVEELHNSNLLPVLFKVP